jgi:hypothetical protein
MNNLKLSIIINKPIEEVFSFAIDSNNISKWYPSIKEEIPSELPIKNGTIIKNRGDDISKWNYYEVSEFIDNKTFTLNQIGSAYHVKYTFSSVEDGTLFEYFEWVDVGELEEPSNLENLMLLKKYLEV